MSQLPDQPPRQPRTECAERKIRVFKHTLATEKAATKVVLHLIHMSQWFSLEPLPCDMWEIIVKEEMRDVLLRLVEWPHGPPTAPRAGIGLARVLCAACGETYTHARSDVLTTQYGDFVYCPYCQHTQKRERTPY